MGQQEAGIAVQQFRFQVVDQGGEDCPQQSTTELTRYTPVVDRLRFLQGIENARNIVLLYIDPEGEHSSLAEQSPVACGELVYSAHERTHVSAVPELKFIHDIPVPNSFDGAVIVLPPRYCEHPLGQKSARILEKRLDPEIQILGDGFVSKVGRGKFVWLMDPVGDHPSVSNVVGEKIAERLGLTRGDISPWKS